MNLHGLWQLLHLVFAFSYVGSLTLAEWNSRGARKTTSWPERARLFEIIHVSSRIAGAGALFVTGLLGHASAIASGYRMGEDRWMIVVTVVWLVALAGMLLLNLPLSARLAAIARGAADGGASDGWASALARWRFANMLQSALYLVMLGLMVFPWKS